MSLLDLINDFIVFESEIQIKYLAKLNFCHMLSQCSNLWQIDDHPEIKQQVLMILSNLITLREPKTKKYSYGFLQKIMDDKDLHSMAISALESSDQSVRSEALVFQANLIQTLRHLDSLNEQQAANYYRQIVIAQEILTHLQEQVLSKSQLFNAKEVLCTLRVVKSLL